MEKMKKIFVFFSFLFMKFGETLLQISKLAGGIFPAAILGWTFLTLGFFVGVSSGKI